MNEAKLLACPHCGSDAVLYENEKGCFVMCQNTSGKTCDIGNTHNDWTRAAVIEMWNARAGGQQPAVSQPPGVSTSASANGSPAQWQELALAALKVCYYRPHPREWWDGDMREDREKEYDAACKRMGELKKELGLENSVISDRVAKQRNANDVDKET